MADEDGGITICHARYEEYDVYGGRAPDTGHILNTPPAERGWLGNPSTVSDDNPRAQAVLGYAHHFETKIGIEQEFKNNVEGLRGKRVACFCRRSDEDEPLCHLDVVDTYLREGRDGVSDLIERLMERVYG